MDIDDRWMVKGMVNRMFCNVIKEKGGVRREVKVKGMG